MSTTTSTIRTALVRAAGLGALALASPTALAQQVQFNPALHLEGSYTDNVDYAGSQPHSDTMRRLMVELPYRYENPTNRLYVSYRPSFVRQREFEELDRDEHRFDGRWNAELGRKSGLGLVTSYSSTQEQGAPETVEDPQLYLAQRADRDVGRAELKLTRKEAPRWDWELSGGGSIYRFDPVEGSTADPDNELEDRDQYGAATRVMRKMARDSALGVRYDYRHFRLDESGEEDSHTLGVTWDKRLAERTTLTASLGGFLSRGDTIEDDGEKVGGAGEFRLDRRYERFRMQLDAVHRPSSGGSLTGTATQTSIALAFVSSGQRRVWQWRAAPDYARRDPSSGDETIHAYGVRSWVERRFGEELALRLRADWYDQTSQLSVFETGLAFRWYPWGGSPLGRGRG